MFLYIFDNCNIYTTNPRHHQVNVDNHRHASAHLMLRPFQKHDRDIVLDNRHSIQFLIPLLPVLHLIMMFEMLNVLRMHQILLGRVRPMVLLEMVDLVLVLVVPVVSRPVPEIRQLDSPRVGREELVV